MNLNLFNNKKLVVFISILLLIGLFSALYFFVLYPKKEEVSIKESELLTQEQILSTLQSKASSTNTSTFQSTVALQKMVPVKPLSQQILLDIEKAEVISGSFVVGMSFEDGEVTLEEDVSSVETDEEDIKQSETVETNDEKVLLPAGVKKIIVTLEVESPSYFEFEEFISILENSERITVVESVDFTANEEIIEEDQTNKPLSYQVRLSAFYMPTLSDLIEGLPKMDSPSPSEKKNPFSEFGDYSNSRDASSKDSVTTKSNKENSGTGSEDSDVSSDENENISDSEDTDSQSGNY
jgi:type IV pilus assembly protein PilO